MRRLSRSPPLWIVAMPRHVVEFITVRKGRGKSGISSGDRWNAQKTESPLQHITSERRLYRPFRENLSGRSGGNNPRRHSIWLLHALVGRFVGKPLLRRLCAIEQTCKAE